MNLISSHAINTIPEKNFQFAIAVLYNSRFQCVRLELNEEQLKLFCFNKFHGKYCE